MELTYDAIEKWIKDYLDVFSTFGQDSKTANRLNDYLLPEMEFIPYVSALERTLKSRADFLQYITSHPSSYERLTSEDIAIDERRGVVVVLMKREVIDSGTGTVLVTKRSMSHYQLALDDRQTIKIKTIRLFWQDLPNGMPEVKDIFDRDKK